MSTLGGKAGRRLALADGLGRASLDGALQHFAEHRGAEAPAQDLHRDLARAEARQGDGPADLAEPVGDLFLELAGRDDDAEFALEPVGVGFCHLHEKRPVVRNNLVTPWCGRGDLNPHDLHRWNLNPVRLPIPPRPPPQLPKRLVRPVRDAVL